jgi:hypothetical protein
LFEHTQKRELQKMKFWAALVGVDIDKEAEETPRTPPKLSSKSSGMMFRDPKDYEHMSKEERQALTDKMMGAHQRVMAKTPIGSARRRQ